MRKVVVLAHGGHWLNSLLYLAPVAIVALGLKLADRRERRRERTRDRTKCRGRPGP